MHFYALVRGIKHDVDRYINDLQAQYFPYEVPHQPKGYVQLAVRPIQLFEFVFPKDSLQEVLMTISPDIHQWHVGNPPQWKSQDKYIWALRKMLKAKEIPVIDPKTPRRLIYNFNVHVQPIGIKDDEINMDPFNKDHPAGKEML